MVSVKPAQADTYKCFATNEYGKAVCTATLKVIAGKRQSITFQYINCKLIKLQYNILKL